jgi:DNA invertase Pin-like site-specific DNA recombinase
MSIGVYVRVSKGKGRGQDTASQLPDLKRWVAAQGEPAKWYTDHMTGKTMRRPKMDQLLEDVAGGKVRTIVVWRLDRLGRTAKGLTALFEDLAVRKVNLVSLKDGIDLSTEAGRLMANVLASVAAYETEVRAARIVAGLEAAREAGRKLGPPVGSRAGKRLKVTPKQEALITRLKAEGQGVSAIAEVTGLSRPTIYSILKATASPGVRIGA